ncbi:MAG: FecR family protein [Rhodospirillaceae bacterium]
MSDDDKIVTFPDTEVLDAEAATWIVRLDVDSASDRDRAAFEAWCTQSRQHQEAADRAAQTWANSDMLASLKGRKANSMAQPTLLERFGFEVRHRIAVLGSAAAVAVVLILGQPFFLPRTDVPQIHRTVIGTQKTVLLTDGSELQLNTDSEIEVVLTKESRNVRLQRGEVHFTVAVEKKRPFSVYVDNRVITAVGTAFSVYRREKNIEVTVTEGDVRLYVLPENPRPEANVGGETFNDLLVGLTAGENAIVSDTIEKVTTISPPEMNRKLAWRQGLLAFAGEPLAAVVSEVSRYTDIQIVIQDPALKELRFGGFLKVGNVDTLFNALEQSFGVKVEREGMERVILSSASL